MFKLVAFSWRNQFAIGLTLDGLVGSKNKKIIFAQEERQHKLFTYDSNTQCLSQISLLTGNRHSTQTEMPIVDVLVIKDARYLVTPDAIITERDNGHDIQKIPFYFSKNQKNIKKNQKVVPNAMTSVGNQIAISFRIEETQKDPFPNSLLKTDEIAGNYLAIYESIEKNGHMTLTEKSYIDFGQNGIRIPAHIFTSGEIYPEFLFTAEGPRLLKSSNLSHLVGFNYPDQSNASCKPVEINGAFWVGTEKGTLYRLIVETDNTVKFAKIGQHCTENGEIEAINAIVNMSFYVVTLGLSHYKTWSLEINEDFATNQDAVALT